VHSQLFHVHFCLVRFSHLTIAMKDGCQGWAILIGQNRWESYIIPTIS